MKDILPQHGLATPTREQPLPFNIHTFAADHLEPQAAYPHRHSFYQVLYVTAGQGTHVLDFEAFPVEPPVLFFLSPEQVHFWRLERSLAGCGILFTSEFLLFDAVDPGGFNKLAFFHSLTHSLLRLTPEQDREIETLVQGLLAEYQAHELNYASVLSAYLHILLAKIQRFYLAAQPPATGTDAALDLVRQFKQLAAQHFNHERSVSFYAERMGVTPDYLAERVRAATGYTAGQILRQEATLEAKRLLINTSLPVAQIGYQLGFDDPAYFGRFFKREAGTSPARFRQHIREKYQIPPV